MNMKIGISNTYSFLIEKSLVCEVFTNVAFSCLIEVFDFEDIDLKIKFTSNVKRIYISFIFISLLFLN